MEILNNMNKMTLDEEMKLWEERSNDEFGQILTKIKKATKGDNHPLSQTEREKYKHT